MKKDITPIEVTDVAVAIAPREGDTQAEVWDTYLINLRGEALENVIVASKGYGQMDGRDKTTTVLRHFFESIPAKSVIRVEPIQAELFQISNEYWVSFNLGTDMLDKKFVFEAGTVSPQAMREIPLLGRPGVIIS